MSIMIRRVNVTNNLKRWDPKSYYNYARGEQRDNKPNNRIVFHRMVYYLADFIALTTSSVASFFSRLYSGVSLPTNAILPSSLLCTPHPYLFVRADARIQGCPLEKNAALAVFSSSSCRSFFSAYTLNKTSSE